MVPFWTVHAVAAVMVFRQGWSWAGLGLCVASYYLRMFGVAGGFHRYFAHRSYKTSRVMQFLLALLGTFSAQKGVLWWAAHHRAHHKYSDEPEDLHSVRQRGFYWAHVGWALAPDYNATDWDRIRDFAKYPELRWLNRWYLVPPIAYALTLYLVGGTWALTWGFFVSTVVLWHGTFTINSLSHLIGSRRYGTTDDSRNNFFLALLTLGEGWHNNHHYYQRSTAQGFYWWEIDIAYYILKGMSWIGLVHDLHRPPRHVRDAHEGAAPSRAAG
jgi:stearoyl-CoA desaturase (Delta-9 desaturase)